MKKFCTCLYACLSLASAGSLILLCSGCIGHKQTQKTRIKTKELTQQTEPIAPSPWSSKKIGELSLDEAQSAYRYYKKNNRTPHIAAVLERLILLTPNQEQLEPLLHELINIKIELGLLEEAEALLEEYCLLYPGNPQTPYKRVQKISVQIQQFSSSERDISKAEKALEEGYAIYNKHKEQAILTEHELETLVAFIHLAQKMVSQKAIEKVLFYLNRFAYTERTQALETAHKNMQALLTLLAEQPDPALLNPDQKTDILRLQEQLVEQKEKIASERAEQLRSITLALQKMVNA